MIGGMIVLDLGATAADIANRTVIVSLRPDIRIRLATIYMAGKFAGAGLLGWLAAVAWSAAAGLACVAVGPPWRPRLA